MSYSIWFDNLIPYVIAMCPKTVWGVLWTSTRTLWGSLGRHASFSRGALSSVFSFENIFESICCYRYGLKEGLKTKKIEVKHAHDVAAKFQQVTPISIHENVPDYEEAGQTILCICDHEFNFWHVDVGWMSTYFTDQKISESCSGVSWWAPVNPCSTESLASA